MFYVFDPSGAAETADMPLFDTNVHNSGSEFYIVVGTGDIRHFQAC